MTLLLVSIAYVELVMVVGFYMVNGSFKDLRANVQALEMRTV